MPSSPELIRLKQAGDSLTMQVESCQKMAIGTYPEVSFVGTDGPRVLEIRVPEKSANRQLERLMLSYMECSGKVMTFARDPNPKDTSKPYWSILLAAGQTVPAMTGVLASKINVTSSGILPQAQPAFTPKSDDERLNAIFAVQEACFQHAYKMAKALNEKMGVPITLEGLSALTAQCMIPFDRGR